MSDLRKNEDMKDSISIIKEMVQQDAFFVHNKIWIIAAIISLIVVVMVVGLLYVKSKKKRQMKKKVLKETANYDFSSITHDWEKNKQLYDILKRKCHPDKFGDDLNKEATRIFQQVVKNKYKYQELLFIKQEAIEKLGIEVEEIN